MLDNDNDEEKTPTEKTSSSTKVGVMTTMMEQCEAIEKEEDNPD